MPHQRAREPVDVERSHALDHEPPARPLEVRYPTIAAWVRERGWRPARQR